MFAFINRLSDAAGKLSASITHLSQRLESAQIAPTDGARLASGIDELGARVASLEQQLAIRMAEAEALLLEAKGDRRAARSAEERARRYAERVDSSNEVRGDEIDGAGDDEGEGPFLRDGDAQNGHSAGVLPVRASVASRLTGAQVKRNASIHKFRSG